MTARDVTSTPLRRASLESPEAIERWRTALHQRYLNVDLVDSLCDLALKGLESAKTAARSVDYLKPGDTFRADGYGLVRFERWDVYSGQRTAEITLLDYGQERRNPLPDALQARIERASFAQSAELDTTEADVWRMYINACKVIAELRGDARNWATLKEINECRANGLSAWIVGCDSTSATMEQALEYVRKHRSQS